MNPYKVEHLFRIIDEEIQDEEARLEEEGINPPRLSVGLKRALRELKALMLDESWKVVNVSERVIPHNKLERYIRDRILDLDDMDGPEAKGASDELFRLFQELNRMVIRIDKE